MIYLSGHIGAMRHPRLGFLITPDLRQAAPEGCAFAADNGCFSNPRGYSDDHYLRFLDGLPRAALFAPAPDIVGNHVATIKRSGPMLRRIRDAGYRAAFCAQDGWEDQSTPWDELDVLFIGGSTAFKFRAGREAAHAAKRRGKSVHMGRVNSLDRLRAATAIGCDTADGTFLRFGPNTNTPRLLAWLDDLDRAPMLPEAA
jgi:hypothetical protein